MKRSAIEFPQARSAADHLFDTILESHLRLGSVPRLAVAIGRPVTHLFDLQDTRSKVSTLFHLDLFYVSPTANPPYVRNDLSQCIKLRFGAPSCWVFVVRFYYLCNDCYPQSHCRGIRSTDVPKKPKNARNIQQLWRPRARSRCYSHQVNRTHCTLIE